MRRRRIGSTWRSVASVLPITFFLSSGATLAADTCRELEILQGGGRSMVSLPPTLVPSRDENPSANTLASSWKCAELDQGADSLVTCQSNWSSDARLAVELTLGLARELRACAGKDWQQRTARLDKDRATTFLYRDGANIEYETSLQRREAPSALGVGAAVGVPGKIEMESRAEFVAIRLTPTPVAASSPDPRADPLCQQLLELVEHARSDFRDLRGSKSGDAWASLKALPETTECEIDDATDFSSHQCLRGTYPSRTALRAEQVNLRNTFSICLGSGWKGSSRPRGDGVWIYSIAQAETDVTIELRGRSRKEKFALRIDVDHQK